jgi:hypothetical protein
LGNLVGEAQLPPDEGKIALVAIDFEKAMAIRGPYPLTTTPQIPPSALWPSGTLGKMATGCVCPETLLSAIEKTTKAQVLGAFAQIEGRIGQEVAWKENSAQLLERRSRDIRKLVKEVWR